MIVELANKFRFEVDDIVENVNANMIPSLHLRSTGKNINSLKSSTVVQNFDNKSLSTIKIFENKDSTIPIAIYNEYIQLSRFEKVFSGSSGSITIILTTTANNN